MLRKCRFYGQRNPQIRKHQTSAGLPRKCHTSGRNCQTEPHEFEVVFCDWLGQQVSFDTLVVATVVAENARRRWRDL
ncbi:hypothetical protein Poly24_33570 [Rosistilla carotiformis]|uniref:Uncharacterized protein n=1 Tax=Rosistilla carotiformis TaxID=2528017 RepID=A0A518JVS5_9BACT|nr:hypothetical protein Poly24_33570 [Rosistilla carotiformis]